MSQKKKFYKEVEEFGASLKQSKITFKPAAKTPAKMENTQASVATPPVNNKKLDATEGTGAESSVANDEKNELINNKRQREETPTKPNDKDKVIKLTEIPESVGKHFEDILSKITNKLDKMETDISGIAKMLSTTNETIGNLSAALNETKANTETNKRNIDAINKRLGSNEKSVVILENDYKLFKTKVDRFAETLSSWKKERVSREEFTSLADQIEATSNMLQNLKDGGNHQEFVAKVKELKEIKQQTKAESTIVLSRLPKRPNQLPQALLTNLHMLLGLPIMSLPVTALEKDNTSLAIELGSRENLENYSKQLKRGLKILQNSKPTNKEILRVSKLSIEPFFEEPLNSIKKRMKAKANELFQEYKLRSHKFIRIENNIRWALRAEKPEDMTNRNLECWKMFGLDEQNDIVDISETMSGFENFTFDQDYGLLIREWSK